MSERIGGNTGGREGGVACLRPPPLLSDSFQVGVHGFLLSSSTPSVNTARESYLFILR